MTAPSLPSPNFLFPIPPSGLRRVTSVATGLVFALIMTACPSPREDTPLPTDRLVIAWLPLTGENGTKEGLKEANLRFENALEEAARASASIEIRRLRPRRGDEDPTRSIEAMQQWLDTEKPGHLLLWGTFSDERADRRFNLSAGTPVHHPGASIPNPGMFPRVGFEPRLDLDPIREASLAELPQLLEGLASVYRGDWNRALEIWRGLESSSLRSLFAASLFHPQALSDFSTDELVRSVQLTNEAASLVDESTSAPTALAIRSANASALLALGKRLQGQACVEPLNRAGVLFGRILEDLQPSQSAAWAAGYQGLAESMLRLGRRGEGPRSVEYLQASLTAYGQAIHARPERVDPQGFANVQFHMALAYQALAERVPKREAREYLEQGAACLHRVLEVKTPDVAPLTWASAQANLGEIFLGLGNRTPGTVSPRHYFNAVSAFSRALEVYTPEASREAWARTHEFLGIAYASLGEWTLGPESVAHLRSGIEALQTALEATDRETDPRTWATTQNNLSRAYASLARKSGDAEAIEYYTISIEACRLALDAYGQESQSVAAGLLHHNLGLALNGLVSRTGDEEALVRLEAADQAFKIAIETFLDKGSQDQWIASQRNLAETHLLWGEMVTSNENAAAHFGLAADLLEEVMRPVSQGPDPVDFARLSAQRGHALRLFAAVTSGKNAEDALEDAASTLAEGLAAIPAGERRELRKVIQERIEAVRQQRELLETS